MTTPPNLARINLAWCDAPCLHVWTHDNQQHHYPLTPSETLTIVQRLVSYLGHLHRPAPHLEETNRG